MSNITSHLHSKGYTYLEGYSQQAPYQVYDLISIIANKPNLKIMEIGFNGGHSAEVFLEYNPTSTLTSFDIGEHDYVHVAKNYIDSTYPNRHELILGDSTVTVPLYIDANKDKKFDVIFIDGGHTYEIARTDMENCKKLSHKDTIVILDDTYFTKSVRCAGGWADPSCHAIGCSTPGPTKTWLEHIEQNQVIEINRKEYSACRGMVWGKYVL